MARLSLQGMANNVRFTFSVTILHGQSTIIFLIKTNKICDTKYNTQCNLWVEIYFLKLFDFLKSDI